MLDFRRAVGLVGLGLALLGPVCVQRGTVTNVSMAGREQWVVVRMGLHEWAVGKSVTRRFAVGQRVVVFGCVNVEGVALDAMVVGGGQ